MESQNLYLAKHICQPVIKPGHDCQTVISGVNVHKLLFFSLCFALLLVSAMGAEKKKTAKCNICKDIVSNFHKGLSKTAKSNYGGGNTKWEEKSLGSYATSEVRLVEIMEQLCSDGSKDCHTVLEEHEELVERYWFREFAQKKDTDLHVYLCIEHMEVCCPNNTYGKDCTPCAGGVHRVCTGNGNCDGAGTREGTGKCGCYAGYQGELCNECKGGYYEESSNETHTLCKVCHISCKDTCTEAGPTGCDECKSGWLQDEELGCLDINECSEDPCDEDQFCTNTQGSYSCFSCDEACSGCTGAGPNSCVECSSGFTMDEEAKKCIDNDECEQDSSLCTGENTECKNTPGSYECVCKSGFVMRDDVCVLAPKETDDDKEEENAGDSEDDSVKEEL